MINYAHRGASEYAPENTLSAFYLGLLQGANGIETDVQQSKDGALVLFHDDDLMRAASVPGAVRDYTLAELQSFRVTGNCTTGFFDRIVTLREFLEKFTPYPLYFAIELKTESVARPVIDLLHEFDAAPRATVTSFSFDGLRDAKQYDPAIRVGLLTPGDGCDRIAELQSIGGEEMAPEARCITPDSVRTLRQAGLGVRAWGVTDIAQMRRMCALGVDGMTVNFPDRLTQYLAAAAR